jgi:S1-C subfamily serine protease
MEKPETRFIAFLSILAASLAGGAFALSWAPSNQFFDFAPVNDGYVEPRNVMKVVEDAQESTVTVYCNVTKKKGSQGTGWAIDAEVLQTAPSKTVVMTNHHVIEECIGLEGSVTISKLYKKEKPAEILVYDKKNDLAILETDVKLPALELSKNYMWPGYWVMTLGSAAGYEGSVSFGNVINTLNEDVLITNNISEGNSGGPLIDNEGKVVGIVTWGSENDREQFNGARSLDTFCLKIVKCEYEFEGEGTWLDYSE